jgi:hypothetical protein
MFKYSAAGRSLWRSKNLPGSWWSEIFARNHNGGDLTWTEGMIIFFQIIDPTLMKSGIIDPTKVVRLALQNAPSVASLMITTQAMVAEKPEKKAPMPPLMPPGGRDGLTAVDREIENQMPKVGVVFMLLPFSHHLRYTINTKRGLQRDF